MSIAGELKIGKPKTVKIINPTWRSDEVIIENCIFVTSHN
jgi:hypothetical protein